MKLSKRQLVNIISENLQINESILLSLLVGCKSECSLYSVAPELRDLKIPECVTQEIYPFETLDWESGIKPSEIQRIAQNEGYDVDLRTGIIGRSQFSDDSEVYFELIKIVIKNVPQRLVRYICDVGIFEPSPNFLNMEIKEFEDDKLCHLYLNFPRYPNESGEDIICKNVRHVENLFDNTYHEDWNDYWTGSIVIHEPDIQCNEDFMAVVANIDPKLTPDEDTGY